MNNQKITPEQQIEYDKKLLSNLISLRNYFFDKYYINHGKTEEEGIDNIKKYIDKRLSLDLFEWMKSWLIAYSKENEIDVEKIMDWINRQPMTSL